MSEVWMRCCGISLLYLNTHRVAVWSHLLPGIVSSVLLYFDCSSAGVMCPECTLSVDWCSLNDLTLCKMATRFNYHINCLLQLHNARGNSIFMCILYSVISTLYSCRLMPLLQRESLNCFGISVPTTNLCQFNELGSIGGSKLRQHCRWLCRHTFTDIYFPTIGWIESEAVL